MTKSKHDQMAEAITAEKNGYQLQIRLIDAGPMGRTLASVAEEEGWTPAQARRAVEALRKIRDDNVTYAPESRTFYWVP